MKLEKMGVWLAYIFQLIILILTILAIYEKRYADIIMGVVALIITFLPLMLKKRWYVTLPWILNLLIAASFAFHLGGEIQGFYRLLSPFYDKVGHFLGSVTVSLLGLALVIIFDKHTKAKLTRIHFIFFIIIFTMALGAFWEIGEFLLDVFTGMKNQPSLEDTMYDIIFNFLGSTFIALLVYTRFEIMKKNIGPKKSPQIINFKLKNG